MKVLDTSNLVPYVVEPVADPDEAVAMRNAGRRSAGQLSMTAEQQENFLRHLAVDAADEAWLRANMPVGTVFDVLGVTHMVVAIGRERAAFGRAWQARVARPDGNGGLEHEDIKVAGLRARVEPAYASGGVVGRPAAS